MILGPFIGCLIHARLYRSKVNLSKLRPTILKRIESQAKEYLVHGMVSVAQEVLMARSVLFHGVTTLHKVFPIMACKFCLEVYIQTCHGYKHHVNNRVHEWISGGVNDILAPVETFHL